MKKIFLFLLFFMPASWAMEMAFSTKELQKQQHQEALKLFKQGNIDDALSILKQPILATYPNALTTRATLELKKKNYQEAHRLLEAVIREYDYTPAIYNLAKIAKLKRAGIKQNAAHLMDVAFARGFIPAKYEVAKDLFAQGKWQEAINLMREVEQSEVSFYSKKAIVKLNEWSNDFAQKMIAFMKTIEEKANNREELKKIYPVAIDTYTRFSNQNLNWKVRVNALYELAKLYTSLKSYLGVDGFEKAKNLLIEALKEKELSGALKFDIELSLAHLYLRREPSVPLPFLKQEMNVDLDVTKARFLLFDIIKNDLDVPSRKEKKALAFYLLGEIYSDPSYNMQNDDLAVAYFKKALDNDDLNTVVKKHVYVFISIYYIRKKNLAEYNKYLNLLKNIVPALEFQIMLEAIKESL